MLVFLLRRLLLMIPTTLGIALVIFALYHAAPGDPATVMMGIGSGGAMGTSEDVALRREAFKREHGLDRSLGVQFLNYIGPFNLMRDGHPWFSSPYTERKVVQRSLPGGGSFAAGVPLEIAPLPGTSREDSEAFVQAARDVARGGPAAEPANRTLAAAGRSGWPALLTALKERAGQRGERAAEETQRLCAALRALTGAAPSVPSDYSSNPPHLASIEAWFGWYYTAGGGARVSNSGARPYAGLLALDLGREMQTRQPVAEELWKRLQTTLPLSVVSVLLSYLIALPLGIFSARRQGSSADAAVTLGLFVLYSIPTFWAGLMLVLVFGRNWLDWLPVVGLHDKDASTFTRGEYLWDLAKHSVLPIFTLTYGSLAYIARQMRSGLLEVIQLDYVRTARAKGLSESVVIYKHALRNALIPVITLLATILPILIGGSIIVEQVFDIPGMGKYAFEGLMRRDFSIIMATTLFTGVMTQIGILLSDLAYSWVDPRIRNT
jgi:peptide/nickel transport system permease protein